MWAVWHVVGSPASIWQASTGRGDNFSHGVQIVEIENLSLELMPFENCTEVNKVLDPR
jgi:hypothetical protein